MSKEWAGSGKQHFLVFAWMGAIKKSNMTLERINLENRTRFSSISFSLSLSRFARTTTLVCLHAQKYIITCQRGNTTNNNTRNEEEAMAEILLFVHKKQTNEQFIYTIMVKRNHSLICKRTNERKHICYRQHHSTVATAITVIKHPFLLELRPFLHLNEAPWEKERKNIPSKFTPKYSKYTYVNQIYCIYLNSQTQLFAQSGEGEKKYYVIIWKASRPT